MSHDLASGIKIENCNEIMNCVSCIKGKLTKKPFLKNCDKRSNQCLDLIHSDVCGPMKTETPGTFIDDHSRYTILYLLHSKDEVFQKFEEYVALVENKFGVLHRMFRFDNEGEYCGSAVQGFLKKKGISFQTTVPYSPEQNGIAERKN